MKMASLRDFVEVKGRFHRSVRLNRDWEERGDLGDYLLTPTARELATRMTSALEEAGGARAWSVTGPYGSGKSAFALFLTDLLAHGPPQHPRGADLRQDLALTNAPFVPILVVGQRAPIKPALLGALAAGIESIDSTLADEISATREGTVNDEWVVELFERAAEAASDAGRGGLLVIVDEFGKFLEHVALHPETEDLFVMQGLAEAAARSPVPVLLVTMLHTAFNEYLGTSADDSRRAEWQKVQGRYTDVAFQEPPEQLLRLVGSAIVRNRIPKDMENDYKELVERAVDSPALEEARRRLPLEELLPACTPLDPIVALLLWPLFRSKLAQNERSLFAFLTGHEPFGFVDFLSKEDPDGGSLPLYRVDRLYDYATTALGAGAYRGDLGKRWVEIDHALHRVGADAPPLAGEVVKAVGVIGTYGRQVGLRPSREAISLALGDEAQTTKALEYLEHASILIYRRHEGAYGLWEGSDVDLDARFEDGLEQTGYGGLAERLDRAVELRPLVARAHYIKTGTLRYFDVEVLDGTATALKGSFFETIAPADGRISFVLSPKPKDRSDLMELALNLSEGTEPTGAGSDSRLRVFAFPEPMSGLEEALREVEAWGWVKDNVPELAGDPVARRELQARQLHAQARLEEVAGGVLGLRGHGFDPEASAWVQDGGRRNHYAAKEFLSWLSALCDEVFHEAPILHNELLNRNQLSSSAAAARRSLLERMLSREDEPDLGIEGTPPEASMYASMLASAGFHNRREDGKCGFRAPTGGWMPIWENTEKFLASTQGGRRPLTDLYDRWKRSPFGLKEGPLPVLLCAVVLAHRDDVALYEDGVFVPEIRIETFERLLRSPGVFEIQRFVLTEHGREALKAVGTVTGGLEGPEGHDTKARLLEVVRPMVLTAARLPAYAKYTRRVEPPQAVGFREALLSATDPYVLLFEELPGLLGVSIDSPEEASRYADLSRECLRGLQTAYPRLLDRLEEQFREAFDLRGSSEEAKEQLRSRAEPLVGYAADRTLSLFVREASRRNDKDWREALARVVSDGTPPSAWRDADAVNFQLRLREVASDFVRLEELVAEKGLTGTDQILRIGILNGRVRESREVVAVTPERAPVVSDLAGRIAELLEGEPHEGEEGRRIRLAALTQVAMRDLRHEGEEEDG